VLGEDDGIRLSTRLHSLVESVGEISRCCCPVLGCCCRSHAMMCCADECTKEYLVMDAKVPWRRWPPQVNHVNSNIKPTTSVPEESHVVVIMSIGTER
jgi:hypothetical protein